MTSGCPPDRVRVLQVIDSLGAGGAETALAEMLPKLQEHAIDTEVLYLRETSEGVGHQIMASAPTHRLAADGAVTRVVELRRRIAQRAPDLIHTTLFDASMCGRVAALGSGVPLLTSLVNDSYGPARYADPALRPWRLRAVQAADGWSARHLATHHHAITQAVKRAAVEQLRLVPERITVIPRGHDPRRFPSPDPVLRTRIRRRLQLPADAEVVLNVGRQEFQKGQADLLHATAELLSVRPRLHVLIAGRTGNATSQLLRLHAELGLGDRVRILGHRSDVVELLAACDVFAFPSRFEGLGNALLEAMAMRTAVVASDVPAVREVVEPGCSATLVPAGSPTRLASALAGLLDDTGRRRAYGDRGREIFLARFTLDRVVRALATLYRTLVTPAATRATVTAGPHARA